MEDEVANWLEFGAILIVTGSVVCCMFHFLLGIRWIHRQMEMNEFLESLADTYAFVHPFSSELIKETKTLDCEVGDFRCVAFT